jgi:hypothetical protein
MPVIDGKYRNWEKGDMCTYGRPMVGSGIVPMFLISRDAYQGHDLDEAGEPAFWNAVDIINPETGQERKMVRTSNIKVLEQIDIELANHNNAEYGVLVVPNG